MSGGAIVTSNGEAHKGFHQAPNVLRDKYLPLIKVDGYGLLNYLLSWANANTPLSQRRMQRDLACSSQKLIAMQERLLEHCGHFITKESGGPTTPNRWHFDLETLWAENQIHMGELAKARLAKRKGAKANEGVSERDTPPPIGVSERDTPCVREGHTPVSERDTHKRKGNTNQKEEEVTRARSNKPAEPNASSSVTTSPLEKTEVMPSEPETAMGEAPELEALLGATEPSGPTVASQAGLTQPTGGSEPRHATNTENVPPARENIHEVDARLQELTNSRWLTKQPNAARWIDEVGPAGVDRHRIAECVSLERLEALWAEARGEVRQAKAGGEAGPTAITRLIRKLEAVVARREELDLEMQRAGFGLDDDAPEPQQTAVKPQEQQHGWVVGDEVVYGGREAEVVTVTALGVEIYLLDTYEFVTLPHGRASELERRGRRDLGHEDIPAKRLAEFIPAPAPLNSELGK